MGWLGSIVLVIGFIHWLRRRPKISGQHYRGRHWQRSVAPQLDPGDAGFQLINHRFPSRVALGHVAVVGATGSGKTLLQRLLWQSVNPHLGHTQRALIYDAKQDTCSLLKGMGVSPILLNPLDARSAAWNLAADITTPASALQVASLLIPDTAQDANPFLTNASRLLLYGTLVALICRSPGTWTFRQLLLLVRDPFRLKQALASTPHTTYLVKYFDHEATFQNILSTLLTYTAPDEIIAAAWDRAPFQISLSQWNSSVLVLGNDERNRTAIDTLNRLLFQRLTELILAGPEHNSVRTWLFLDEVREAGKLTDLSRLLTKGRSKGAAVVLGFQDISGLREVYGRQVADELLGQCNTKVLLRLNSPETAAWAERVFGNEEVVETRRGDSHHLGDPLVGRSKKSATES